MDNQPLIPATTAVRHEPRANRYNFSIFPHYSTRTDSITLSFNASLISTV